MLTFVWFVVGPSVLLRRAEGEVPWRSAIVMGSGVLFVALGLSGLGNEAAVALRAGDLDPQIAKVCIRSGTGGVRQRPDSPWQLRRLLRLGHRVDTIPAPLGGMAGDRKRS